MQLTRAQRWWRSNSWRAYCWAAIAVNAFWAFNLYFGGPSFLAPGKCSLSICCGMILLDEDPLAPTNRPISVECHEPPGLRMIWYAPMDLRGLSSRAPWLPFSDSAMHGQGASTAKGWSIGIPFWPAIPLLYLGALLLWRRKRERIRMGFCTLCGYDLKGLRTSVCPECGCIPWSE